MGDRRRAGGFLAGQREDYADEDYDEVEADGSWELKDDVWDRAVAEEEERLRALVADAVTDCSQG